MLSYQKEKAHIHGLTFKVDAFLSNLLSYGKLQHSVLLLKNHIRKIQIYPTSIGLWGAASPMFQRLCFCSIYMWHLHIGRASSINVNLYYRYVLDSPVNGQSLLSNANFGQEPKVRSRLYLTKIYRWMMHWKLSHDPSHSQLYPPPLNLSFFC